MPSDPVTSSHSCGLVVSPTRAEQSSSHCSSSYDDTRHSADFIQQRRQDESPSGSRRASSASEGQHPEVREKLVEQRCPGKKPPATLPSATLPQAFARPRGAAFSQEVVETYSWLRPDELNASGAQLLQDVVELWRRRLTS
ncbi:unnamed protein product [Pleuronectes platessa]|uniref:Uncharacterized protein n=1 Tax=Pleuronectes platessa TaxID=8262 RepID=A0A9N7YRK4_PLEPL|nr:unnamed protein product [Pleuronectes platessa]